MGLISEKNIRLATELIKKNGYVLKQFDNRSVLKLQKGLTTIYFHPKTEKEHETK